MRRPSLDLFALALGVYAGVVALVAVAMTTDFELFARIPLAAAVVVALVVFGFAAMRTDLVVRVVEYRIYSVLAFASAVPLFSVLVAHEVGIVPADVLGDWLLPAFLLLLAVLFLHTTAFRQYITTLREREIVLAEWTASADSQYKLGVRVPSFVGGVVVFIAGLRFSIGFEFWGAFVGTVAGLLFGLALFAGRRRHYILSERGLVVQDSKAVGGKYVPINRVRSVTRSERALTIYRRVPWPFPFRSSITAIRDPDTVESTLREQLG